MIGNYYYMLLHFSGQLSDLSPLGALFAIIYHPTHMHVCTYVFIYGELCVVVAYLETFNFSLSVFFYFLFALAPCA